jgi:hypothetical protein
MRSVLCTLRPPERQFVTLAQSYKHAAPSEQSTDCCLLPSLLLCYAFASTCPTPVI